MMRIAVGQMSCALGDVAANVQKIAGFAAQAKTAGAELVVFPEMMDTGYAMPVIETHASTWRRGAVPELRRITKSLSIAIVCGVSEREGSAIYNAQIAIDARGEMLAQYRKMHLFACAPIDEHDCFAAGETFASFAFGESRFGLSICYDLRFPEVYRRLAIKEKANGFVISSAWPFPRVEHMRVLATARAIENQSYVILANRVGTDAGVTFCGSSAIIDPYGVTIAAAAADREELLCAEISHELIESVRDLMPVFAHRRQELYEAPRGVSVRRGDTLPPE